MRNFQISCWFSLLLLIQAPAGFGQIIQNTYRFGQPEVKTGLASNTVTDLVVTDIGIWLGTGRGLSKTVNDGLLFESYDEENGLGKGGVSAIAVRDDIIWVATGFDTLTDVGRVQAGGGLSYSLDQGGTWTHVPQPGPTPAQNISFDLALRGDEVWIASFGGGLSMSSDLGQSWAVVPPDSFLFNPNAHLNHRVFSVHNAGGTLWVGTAGGINRSTDGGLNWTTFRHDSTRRNETISGNFVVALAVQDHGGRQRVWAGTRETTVESGDPTEFRGISWSEDFGFTWQTALAGETIHNIAFDDSVVYAAADNGLFKSNDFGESWFVFPVIESSDGTRQIFSTEVFTAAATDDHVLWVGTRDGVAKSEDNGGVWDVLQTFPQTGREGEPRTYAYPNPFSPNVHNQLRGDGHVRFQYNTTRDTRVTIKVYDFAMQPVATVVEQAARPGSSDLYETWNGKGERGRQVDNGVYFYRVDLEGDGSFWGKLIIMN